MANRKHEIRWRLLRWHDQKAVDHRWGIWLLWTSFQIVPPIENAGLYRELATLKDLVMSYRQSTNEPERERLFESIEDYSCQLNLNATAGVNHRS